jgi:hypothetical protein
MTHNARQIETLASQMPPREEIAELYRRAFAQFGTRALWNIKQVDNPTVDQILAITRQLRIEGDMDARRIAERIEQAARADF